MVAYVCSYRQKTYGKGEERKIHVSRYAFKTLHENMGLLRAAMKEEGEASEDLPRIKLTRVQLATVSEFTQTRMKYLTISYEKEDGELDFSRTINLSEEEAAVFERIIPQIGEVLHYAEYMHSTLTDSLAVKDGKEDDNAEAVPIKVYVLRNKDASANAYEDDNIFLSERNAQMGYCDLQNKDDYEITAININRPTKYAVVQYVIKEEMLKKAVECEIPMKKEVYQRIDRDKLRVIVLAALKELTYTWPLFVNELTEAFVYCGGLCKILQEEQSGLEKIDMQEEYVLRAAYQEALTHL